MNDIEVEYKSKVEDLEQKLRHFERQCNQHEDVLNSTVQKNKSQIDKLQEEKAMLEVSECVVQSVVLLNHYYLLGTNISWIVLVSWSMNLYGNEC